MPYCLTEEALIHESGHAKLISGKRPERVEKLYEELKSKGVPGVSIIAEKDGAEVIAEVEVLLKRGETIPQEALELYKRYMK